MAGSISKAGTANASHCLPLPLALPKAFQTNALRLFGFFNAHPLNQASLFRVFALKKPLICMRGFVACLGASWDEFAGDVRAILNYHYRFLQLASNPIKSSK